MKQGGVGYVAPDRGSFPEMAKMNRFVAEAGAIPTVAWLDGFERRRAADGRIRRRRHGVRARRR